MADISAFEQSRLLWEPNWNPLLSLGNLFNYVLTVVALSLDGHAILHG